MRHKAHIVLKLKFDQAQTELLCYILIDHDEV